MSTTLNPRTVSGRGRSPWTLVGVVLLPLLVLGLLLWALWSPQDRLDTVRAAIVNQDEPVEIDGEIVPLGRQLAAGLVSGGTASTDTGPVAARPDEDAVNYAWEITDADGAAAGLADGTFAAVVTIPEDFSAAATSFGGEPAEARQATIDVETSPGGRVVDDALARVVTGTASSILGATLTETYVDGVLTGFTTLGDQLGDAADGAVELADGAADAGEGATELADGATQLAEGAAGAGAGARDLAGGAGQVAAGAGELASGVGELGDGTRGLAGGARSLAGGAGDLADGASQSAAGARGIAGGVEELADGTRGLAGGARALADGLATLDTEVAALPGQAQQLADGSAQVADGVGELVGTITEIGDGADEALAQIAAALGCDGSGGLTGSLPPEVLAQMSPEEVAALETALAARSEQLCAAIADARAEIGQGVGQLGELEDGARQVAQGNALLAAGLGELATGVGELSDGAEGLAGGVEETAAGAGDLAAGSRGLADGLGELDAGAGALSAGAGQLASGTGELAAGVGALDAGASGLANGTRGLATGASELATGVGQLATGTAGLASGADDLAGGLGQLADGTSELADGLGQATDEIPTYTDAERENLAAVVADPVTAPGLDGFGSGSTGPVFAVLALWLGALALLVVFPPVPARVLGSTRGPLRLAGSALAAPLGIGALTGAVVGGVLAAVEDVVPGGWVLLIVLGALASVAFVALNQALAAALGNVGRAVSLLVAVLVVATGVVATVPDLLVGLLDVLPVGAALGAMTAVIDPRATGGAGEATALVLWALVSVAVTTLVVAQRRTVREARLART